MSKMSKCWQIDPFVSFRTFMHNRFYICFHAVMFCIHSVYAMPLLFITGCGWCNWSCVDLVTSWSRQSYFPSIFRSLEALVDGIAHHIHTQRARPRMSRNILNFGHLFINWIQLQPKELRPAQSENFALNYFKKKGNVAFGTEGH